MAWAAHESGARAGFAIAPNGVLLYMYTCERFSAKPPPHGWGPGRIRALMGYRGKVHGEGPGGRAPGTSRALAF